MSRRGSMHEQLLGPVLDVPAELREAVERIVVHDELCERDPYEALRLRRAQQRCARITLLLRTTEASV